MKKISGVLLVICLVCFLIPPLPSEGQQTRIVLQIDSQQMTINNSVRNIDVAPFINSITGRTLVPVRFVTEALNASVFWLPETSQVRIVDGSKEILLTIDSTKVISKGEEKSLDAPAVIINSRTFVPLRFVSEELGAKVEWDGATRRITISK